MTRLSTHTPIHPKRPSSLLLRAIIPQHFFTGRLGSSYTDHNQRLTSLSLSFSAPSQPDTIRRGVEYSLALSLPLLLTTLLYSTHNSSLPSVPRILNLNRVFLPLLPVGGKFPRSSQPVSIRSFVSSSLLPLMPFFRL